MQENPLDVFNDVCDKLSVLEMIFADRATLQLNDQQLAGVIRTLWEIQSDLDDIKPMLAVRGNGEAKESGEARNDFGFRPASQKEKASATPVDNPRKALPEDTVLYPDYPTKVHVEKDIALIKHLSRAADQMLLTGTTHKGANADTTDAVWVFIEQINSAAKRVEDAIDVTGDPDFGVAEPEDLAKPATMPDAAAEAARPAGQSAASLDLTEPAKPGRSAAPAEARRDRA